ncbi:MAG: HD-GYP domain-containing protein [Leptospirillum sp.]|jgi:HD-GYP domain-containing protein (c-di-GMP phosphodiesterase class II)
MYLKNKEEALSTGSSLFEILHSTTLVFLEEMMDQLDRWTFERRFHSYRVSVLALEIGKRMSLPASLLMTLRAGALLHDIGKIRIDQEILNKPGPLDAMEWIAMKEHPAHGRAILSRIPTLSFAKDVIYQHHERWNGTGYPHGLKESEILIESRIFGVVDSYDAMVSRRSYNIPQSHGEAMAEIRQNARVLFDPDVVDAFLGIPGDFFEQLESLQSHTRFIEDSFDPQEYLALLIPLGQHSEEK